MTMGEIMSDQDVKITALLEHLPADVRAKVQRKLDRHALGCLAAATMDKLPDGFLATALAALMTATAHVLMDDEGEMFTGDKMFSEIVAGLSAEEVQQAMGVLSHGAALLRKYSVNGAKSQTPEPEEPVAK